MMKTIQKRRMFKLPKNRRDCWRKKLRKPSPMDKIITLTVNPVLDKNTTVNRLVPGQKLRCSAPVFFAGGGGINVSRAIQNLGGTSLAIYLAGGPYGTILEHLMTGKTHWAKKGRYRGMDPGKYHRAGSCDPNALSFWRPWSHRFRT